MHFSTIIINIQTLFIQTDVSISYYYDMSSIIIFFYSNKNIRQLLRILIVPHYFI